MRCRLHGWCTERGKAPESHLHSAFGLEIRDNLVQIEGHQGLHILPLVPATSTPLFEKPYHLGGAHTAAAILPSLAALYTAAIPFSVFYPKVFFLLFLNEPNSNDSIISFVVAQLSDVTTSSPSPVSESMF